MMFSLCCNSTYAEDDNVIISDSNTEEVEIVEEAEEETTTDDAKASVSVASSNSSISVASTDDSNDGIATVAEEEEYIESGTCGDDVIWTLDNDYNLVINGTGEMTSWTNYAKVPWYSYRKSIVSVTIDNGVTSIGKYAFYACAITSVVLPESVTNIEDSAFRSCSSLTNVVINGTVTSIGNYAFQDCSGLTSINLPEGLTSIGNYAFQNCTKLTSIVLPASITEITDGLFNNCTSLINVTAKGKLTAIGNLAFNGCTALTTLTNGSEEDTLTTIGYDAFYNCSALTDIPGLSKVDTMNINGTKGSRAFNGCSSLAGTINLSSLDVIPVRAFYGCKNIEGVTFSDNLTSIGNYAFCSCNKIRKLNFPDTLTSIGDYAFYNCFLNGDNTVETEVSSGSLVYSLTEYKETLSQSRTYTGYTLKIPANVTYVGTKAFYASYVQVFDIGCSLTEIDGTAFATYSLVAMIFDNFETAINYTNKDSLLSKSQSTTSDDLDLIYNQGIAIFLDGINGNDENDGTTLEKAVKTFEKAKELAIEYETTSIYVTGTISISSGEQSWDGQIDEDNTINLIRYKDLNDASLIELDGSSLTLSNIIIDGKSISSTAALIRVNDSNSVLTITDGTVIKNNLNTFTDLSTNPNNAAVCVVTGKLVMTGGEITGNKGHWGGGIALTCLSDTSATMEMTGGTISNNTADEGGGIYMYANATLEMTGNPGGTITNNVSNDHGGGIYIGSGSVGTIYSGYITYNTSKDSDGFGGGGIYVNCAQSDYDNGKLYIYNVEIAYNKVSSSIAQSRGYSSTIACCETGAVEINVTDGAVIHDNETVKAIQVYQESASAIFNLSPIMLGGGVYNWTGSNGIAYELDELSFTSSEARWINAITSVSTSDNTVTGLDRVKTYITGNEAVFVGAAIGSNGEVYIGKSDGDVNLVISKVWDSSINETLESIDVEIYKTSENEGTTMLDTITLSDDNNWSVSITNLPKYDSEANEYTYTVKEVGSAMSLSLFLRNYMLMTLRV
ncbi:MAG: leucine-rich repeat protein, partial [Erysipelotrichaceae bacterium]|nr:leucine-rich repeat protein [Erysipelotrichaceae bacterium]